VTLRYHQKSRSLGTADDGALDGGRCLKEVGPGFIHLNGKKDGASCATDETVNLLMFAIGEVLREYPDTAPVVIGGLSRPGGGPLRPHKSHTSGRDADLGYYALRNRPLAGFDDLPPTAIDFDKTFFLMANLIATGRVSHIFVNYSLQPGLYDAAKAMGYDDRQLAWIFQYPAGRKAKTGIVRHSKGHQRHWHVRFVCPVGDKDCL
jgi:murein endopeptidase